MPLNRLAVLVFALVCGVAVAVNFYVESRRPLLAVPEVVGHQCSKKLEDRSAPAQSEEVPGGATGLKTEA